MRRIFTIALLLFAAFSMNAQVLATFEDPAADILFHDEEWWHENDIFILREVTDNPAPGGLNTSAKAAVAVQYPDADWWGNFMGFRINGDPITITEENRYLKFLAYRSIQPKNMVVYFNDRADETEIYRGNLNQDATWEGVVIDLQKFMGEQLSAIMFIPSANWDDPRNGWGQATYAFDNFELSSDPLPQGVTLVDGADLSIGFENQENTNKWISSYDVFAEESSYEIVDNPHPDAANPTSKVLQFNKSEEASWWQGVQTIFSGLMEVGEEAELQYLHVMVYVPAEAREGLDDMDALIVQLCAKDHLGKEESFDYRIWPEDVNTWMDLSLELINIEYLSELTVRFDLRKDDAGDYIHSPANTFYFDGIELNNEPTRDSIENEEGGGDGIESSVVNATVQVLGVNGAIAVDAAVNGKLEVFNTVGVKVLAQVVSAGETSYTVPAGIYIVRFTAEDGSVSATKVVVK